MPDEHFNVTGRSEEEYKPKRIPKHLQEQNYYVPLTVIPLLILLLGVFAFYLYRKRARQLRELEDAVEEIKHFPTKFQPGSNFRGSFSAGKTYSGRLPRPPKNLDPDILREANEKNELEMKPAKIRTRRLTWADSTDEAPTSESDETNTTGLESHDESSVQKKIPRTPQ